MEPSLAEAVFSETPAHNSRQSHDDTASKPRQSPKQPIRAPAVSIAAAFAAGIAADHFWGTAIPVEGELLLCLLSTVAWGLAFRLRNEKWGAALCLGAVFAIGGAWHQFRWGLLPADDVSQFATEEPQPVRLIGTLASEPYIVPKAKEAVYSAAPRYDRTVTTIAVSSLVAADRRIPVSGLSRLEISGHLLHAQAADEVEVLGKIVLPSGAQNPGGFDFRQHLRNSGIRTIIRTDNPDCVVVVSRRGDWWGQRLRSRWQRVCEATVSSQLSPRTAPLGVAMLLGTRTGMPDELRTAFAESGAMHMLAISGINVGILATFLWACCQIFRISSPTTSAIMIAGVLAYAIVTDAQPPVVRATVMIVIWLIGSLFRRKAAATNLLAIALLLVLIARPVDLFQIGPQLSFLAVMALIWSAGLRVQVDEAEPEPFDSLMLEEKPAWQIGLSNIAKWIGKGYRTTAAVWLFTLPLILARFNLVSPVGFFTDILLMPVLTVTLWAGYGLLIVGTLVPQLGLVFGCLFDLGLRALLEVVEFSARIPGGHFYIPGPPDWWLWGFYGLLGGLTFCSTRRQVFGWCRRGILAWSVLGLALGAPHRETDELRCTFLAVGHGGAILLELPGGGVLLYDAGSLQDADRARQIVQAALWQRGLTQIDALLISHADVDHFNAVEGLIRSIPIGCLLVSPTFLDFQQASVASVCEAACAQGVPIKLIWQGDALVTGGTFQARILHPLPLNGSRRDNANSLVLEIEYADRRVLLTGDLEGDGLAALLKQPARKCDILLGPHHGSLKPNSPALAAWAEPTWVVISGGRGDSAEKLQAVYGESTEILSTLQQGAITFRISAEGAVSMNTFRKKQPLAASP